MLSAIHYIKNYLEKHKKEIFKPNPVSKQEIVKESMAYH